MTPPDIVRDFSHPPVVETVLGVQFSPIAQFSISHFGLYWATIRDRFPKSEVAPALDQEREEFSSARTGRMGFRFVTEPLVRCWFLDNNGNQLVQIQRDRFIFNWRKQSGDEVYPRYERLRAIFESEWTHFCSFLKSEGLNCPEVNQSEVTYVNHIEPDGDWKNFATLNQVFSPWSGQLSEPFLPAPDNVTINQSFVIGENKGRLHISLSPVIRAKDGKEVLQFNLTARGGPLSSDTSQILQWLDLGRHWVVQGFTSLTTAKMHDAWRRTK